jgi:hypothetical protein
MLPQRKARSEEKKALVLPEPLFLCCGIWQVGINPQLGTISRAPIEGLGGSKVSQGKILPIKRK